MQTTQYEGTVVQVGNSRGMRLPAGFFNAHPEFNGKVRATFVADGQVLISAQPAAKGKTTNEIAETLFLSPRTVGTHLYNIKQKLNANNSAEIALIAMRSGLIDP